MSVVKDIVGGYLVTFLVLMAAVLGILGFSLVVSLIAEESVVVIFILAYNGVLGLFIVFSAIPVAAFILVFGLVYNGMTPIMSPFVETILKFIAPMFNFLFKGADITVTPITPSKVDFWGAMEAWSGFINALSKYLLDITDLPYQEPFISLVLRHL